MEAFLARQPIFDENLKVYAYELLFRSSLENYFSNSDPNQAASHTIVSSFLIHGIQTITGGKKAFFNVTRDVLVKEYMTLLPKDQTVVEILETVQIDEEVIESCKNLKKSGYLLALDDFVYDETHKSHVELADIIKVDFLSTKKEERKRLVEKFGPKGIRFLAEKVETQEEFIEARDLGYTYFQGYFFSKPVVISKKSVPGFKLHYLRILQEVNRPDIDFQQIESAIKVDMSLCYKLFRYINSPFFGLKGSISSINQALTLLGENEFKKWISLVVLANMGEDKPEELVILAVIRAKFCEALGLRVGLNKRTSDLFIMGMFSLINAILDQPLETILSEMPIEQDIKDALMGGKNDLRMVFEYMLAYEKGDWDSIGNLTSRIHLKKDDEIPRLYLDSVEWALNNFQTNETPSEKTKA